LSEGQDLKAPGAEKSAAEGVRPADAEVSETSEQGETIAEPPPEETLQ
jgi:hypothetical protein